MIVSPIIPIWIMILICAIFVFIAVKNKNNLIIRLLIVVLLFIINLRIMLPSGTTFNQTVSSNLDVLFVIDNTISMIAEDYNNNIQRLTAVKKDCEYIVEKLNGARFSVITFNDDSQIVIPFVKDVNMTMEAISTIQTPDPFYAKGSTLNVVLDNMIQMLKKSKEKSDRKTIVFFISDGEITNNESLKSFSKAKEYVDSGAVLGYGTKEGGYMKVKEKYSSTEEYLEDTTQRYPYPKAVSKLDEENLKTVAKDIGLEYINMKKQSNIDYKLNEITRNIRKEVVEDNNKNGYIDIYYIFVIPLLVLLVYEFINYKKKML